MDTRPHNDRHPPHKLHLPDVIVTSSWLASHLDNDALRILDARQPAHYAQGHIAGARNAPLERITCTRDGVDGMLYPPDAYAELMSQLGITRDTPVVAYDATWGMAAARLFWSLEYYGHTNVAVLNGGWDLWQAQGLPVAAGITANVVSDFEADPDPRRLATYPWLMQRLNGGANAADLLLIDTRSAAEYVSGHLPGALSWDWMNATAPDGWEAMRNAAELKAELQQIGVTRDKEIVVYCHSGVRAAHTYLVLRALGYPRVRNYDGSWLEWSARAHAAAGQARDQINERYSSQEEST